MVTPDAYAATDSGLVSVAVEEDEVTTIGRALPTQSVRDVAVDPNEPAIAYAGCGLRGGGLYKIPAGENAELLGLEDRWVWGVTTTPDGRLLIGTEPPAVYVSDDGGETLDRRGTLRTLPSREEWHFWYEPFEAGHIHGFAVHSEQPDLILGAVEIGGVIRTDDGGATWTDGLRGRDCHDCLWDPIAPDRAYVAANSGLFRSDDRGRQFEPVDAFADRYVAALAHSGEAVFATAAPAEDAATATLWRRQSRGEWCRVRSVPTEGLGVALATGEWKWLLGADTPHGDHVIQHSSDQGETWSSITVPDRVRAFALR